jgi:hypothetical protein
MLPDKKIKCPYTGFTKTCLDGVVKHNCPKWIHIRGLNPQTGDPVDNFGCSDSFQHLLMIENSQQQRQTGAAVESFRNEMLKLNSGPQQMLLN